MNKFYSLLFFISIVLLSCSDSGNFQIGEDLVDSKSGVLMNDTFSLRLSTVVIDSISTSGIDQLLCGKYTTTFSGSTELRAYFNFDRSTLMSSITKDVFLDSITLELGYSGYYIGDTLSMQEFNLYRLTEPIEFIDNEIADDELYNNSSFPYEEVSMGRVRFYPRISKDSIEFRIDDAFGQELMNMAIKDVDELDNEEVFNDYLRGFVLKSAADSKAIIGFDADTAGVKINLYTHQNDADENETEYHFYLAAEGTHFNQTIADRSGTPYAALRYQAEELRSVSTNDQSLIEGSAGLVTRIDFPTMPEIFSYDDRTMIRAQLILRPSTGNDPDFLPSTLTLYESDRKNQFGSQLTVTSSYQQSAVQATLVKDEMSAENSYYIADISEYLLDKLAGNYYNINNGLLVTIPYSDLQSKADLLILNGEKAPRYRPKLNLYFLKYE